MEQNNTQPCCTRWLIASFVLMGALLVGTVGLGMKTTDQAGFCASCHVMAEAAWTHSQSSHAKLACNECHAPAPLGHKLVFKTEAGTRDIYHNTFQSVADVIHANQSTKDVVQENCRRCHAVTISTVAMDSKPYCTDCHRTVPHKSRTPISKRMAADV